MPWGQLKLIGVKVRHQVLVAVVGATLVALGKEAGKSGNDQSYNCFGK